MTNYGEFLFNLDDKLGECILTILTTCSVKINGSQLVKMKKIITDMSLP